MKIKVTKAELLAIVSKTLGFEVTEVVIAKENTAAVDKFLVSLAKEMGTSNVTESMLTGQFKIAGIKGIRTLTSYGLAEAKWAVENWGAYLKAFSKFGRAPKIEGQCFTTDGPKLL